MSDRKPCIRCQRFIDEYARTCPFCNWDQFEPVLPLEELPAAPVYVPRRERRLGGKILGAVAFVALLIVAFVVGTLIHGFEPTEVKAATAKNATPQVAAAPPLRSNVTLVPVTGSEAPDYYSIEAPITSAPPQAPGQQPNDATALPSDQYAAAAARAKAEREADRKKALVDPRSITAPTYQQSEKTPVQKSERSSTAKHTEAYLQSKPLPHIVVDRDITARLNLTVSAEGRVTHVEVSEPIPDMLKVIAAVQNWRFRPATEKGTPVTAKVAVDITFRANE